MALAGIGSIPMPPSTPRINPVSSPAETGTPAVGGAEPTKSGFSGVLQDAVQRVTEAQGKADSLALQAATGDLRNIHDYTIAASQAQLTTQVTVAVRNKAVEAFQDIMRMPL